MKSLSQYINEARSRADQPQEPLAGYYEVGQKFKGDAGHYDRWSDKHTVVEEIWELTKISKKGTTGTVKLLSINGEKPRQEQTAKIKFECRWYCDDKLKDVSNMPAKMKKWWDENVSNLNTFLRDSSRPHVCQWVYTNIKNFYVEPIK